MGQKEVFQYSSNVAHESLSHVAKKRKRKGALCINYMTQYFENILETFGNAKDGISTNQYYPRKKHPV